MTMQVERKFFATELKLDAAGSVEGYGARFGNRDQGGDVIEAGAFSATLGRRKVRMLFNHDPDKVIGVWDEVREDTDGLRMRGRFVDTPLGQETRKLVQAGALDGLSIGYRTVKADRRDGMRVLQEVDLYEVSVVTFPMNERATVDAVKALDEGNTAPLKRAVEHAVMAAGFSAREAKAAASAAAKEVSAARDAGEALDQLAALIRGIQI